MKYQFHLYYMAVLIIIICNYYMLTGCAKENLPRGSLSHQFRYFKIGIFYCSPPRFICKLLKGNYDLPRVPDNLWQCQLTKVHGPHGRMEHEATAWSGKWAVAPFAK